MNFEFGQWAIKFKQNWILKLKKNSEIFFSPRNFNNTKIFAWPQGNQYRSLANFKSMCHTRAAKVQSIGQAEKNFSFSSSFNFAQILYPTGWKFCAVGGPTGQAIAWPTYLLYTPRNIWTDFMACNIIIKTWLYPIFYFWKMSFHHPKYLILWKRLFSCGENRILVKNIDPWITMLINYSCWF